MMTMIIFINNYFLKELLHNCKFIIILIIIKLINNRLIFFKYGEQEMGDPKWSKYISILSERLANHSA